jgi:hypothetical protein
MARNDFSIASVVLSYFLVAGGVALGLILLTLIKSGGEPAFYGALAAGGAVGGFVAARASRGTTITEPAIGGVLVIATMVGVFVGTDVGEILWHVAAGEITRMVAIAGGSAAAGAIGGACVSEKVFGAHSQSSLAWLLHVSFAVLGACFAAFVVLLGAMMRGQAGDDGATAGMYFGAMGVGALLSGIAAGASAPKRILGVSFLGSIVGVMGFYLLIRALPGVDDEDGDAAIGFAVIGAGCGIVTLLGALVGWKAVGQRSAG